jgi:hypothetical protein
MFMVTAIKTKQQVEVDLLLETAHEIETMSEDKALDMVGSILEESGMSDFRLGGLLGLINTHGWFGVYGSFKTLLKEKFNLEYRKAMYLINIYNVLVEAQIPWSKVSHLGWTKLKELVKILTADNVDEWVELAAGLTVLQLIDAIKKAKGEVTSNKGDSSDVSTLTFKVHADQKEVIQSAIEKAKEELNTEVNTVALENICIAYMGGAVVVQPVQAVAHELVVAPDEGNLPDYFQAVGYEKVLEAWEKAFPDMDLTLTVS